MNFAANGPIPPPVTADVLRLQVRGSGGAVAALLSRAAGQGIRLRRVVPFSGGCTLWLSGRDLAAFSALAGQDCSLKLLARRGPGPFLARLLHRPGLPAGAVLFLVLLRFFAGFVWCMDFGTLAPDDADALRQLLAGHSVTEGCRLTPELLQTAQTAAQSQSESFGWISLNFTGGCLFVESTPTQTQTMRSDAFVPALQARAAGEILAVELESGFSVVKPGQYAAAGQMLAGSQRLDRSGNAVRQSAAGRVIARVQKRYSAASPLQSTTDCLTGRTAYQVELQLPGRRFMLHSDPPVQGTATTEYRPLQLGRISLPGCLIYTTCRQQAPLSLIYTEAQAAALALRDCRRALYRDFPDAVIEREQRRCTVQNGTARAEILYIFTADIAEAGQS